MPDVRRPDQAVLDVVVALARDAGQARIDVSICKRGLQTTVLAHRAASDVELRLDSLAHGIEVRALETVVLIALVGDVVVDAMRSIEVRERRLALGGVALHRSAAGCDRGK